MHEEALACDLAAFFYMEIGETEKALHHFLLAHKKYYEWGAFGKCDSLFKFVESNFSTLPQSVGHTNDANASELGEDLEALPVG